MAKEIKIVDIQSESSDEKKEQELTQLVNAGWRIVAAGGRGYITGGFVILQKD